MIGSNIIGSRQNINTLSKNKSILERHSKKTFQVYIKFNLG